MIKNALTLLFCVISVFLFGQSTVFEGKLIYNNESSELKQVFKNYEIYQIDAKAMHNFALKSKSENLQFQMKLGTKHQFNLDLSENRIQKPGLEVRVATENGIVYAEPSKIKCFNGFVEGTGNQASISIDDNFLFGFVNINNEALWFEPLWHLIPDAPQDQFVFYYSKDYIDSEVHKCGADEAIQKMENLDQKVKNTKYTPESLLACKEVELLKLQTKECVPSMEV